MSTSVVTQDCALRSPTFRSPARWASGPVFGVAISTRRGRSDQRPTITRPKKQRIIIHCGAMRSARPLGRPAPRASVERDGAARHRRRCDDTHQQASGNCDGIGHFKARNSARTIIYTMLTTDRRDLNYKETVAAR